MTATHDRDTLDIGSTTTSYSFVSRIADAPQP